MKSISVIHEKPMSMGGAEAVFMHTLDALQDDYELTVLCAEPCDLTKLNKHYNTQVEDVEFKHPQFSLVNRKFAYRWASRLTAGRLGVLSPLRLGLFHWSAVRESDADLVVHTWCESPYGSPSIQYIHYPQFRRYPSAAIGTPDSSKLDFVERLVSPLSEADDFPSDALLLTNSRWTANDLQSVYGIDATVCHPPVRTDDIPEPLPDSERKNGVIMLGRIAPNKRQHLAFEIVEQTRKRGYDVELTLVGPTSNEEYSERIKKLAESRDYATVRGLVSRKELVRLLTIHRYGLHGHPYEHFGIVVAEMVAAGCLPLVPDDGGQVEVVENIPELIWETPEEAAGLLTALCEVSDLRKRLRSQLSQSHGKYGADRFQKEMKQYVDSILNHRGIR